MRGAGGDPASSWGCPKASGPLQAFLQELCCPHTLTSLPSKRFAAAGAHLQVLAWLPASLGQAGGEERPAGASSLLRALQRGDALSVLTPTACSSCWQTPQAGGAPGTAKSPRQQQQLCQIRPQTSPKPRRGLFQAGTGSLSAATFHYNSDDLPSEKPGLIFCSGWSWPPDKPYFHLQTMRLGCSAKRSLPGATAARRSQGTSAAPLPGTRDHGPTAPSIAGPPAPCWEKTRQN